MRNYSNPGSNLARRSQGLTATAAVFLDRNKTFHMSAAVPLTACGRREAKLMGHSIANVMVLQNERPLASK